MGGLDGADPAGFYIPLPQTVYSGMHLVARSRSKPLAIAPQIRDAIADINPSLGLSSVQSMDQWLLTKTHTYRSVSALLVVLGMAALFLALVGIYGVISLSVTQRTREFGIRIALGESLTHLVGDILRSTLMQIGLGVIFGFALALASSRLFTSYLFHVEPWDLSMFAIVAITVAATSLLACLPTVRQVVTTNPMELLARFM